MGWNTVRINEIIEWKMIFMFRKKIQGQESYSLRGTYFTGEWTRQNFVLKKSLSKEFFES